VSYCLLETALSGLGSDKTSWLSQTVFVLDALCKIYLLAHCFLRAFYFVRVFDSMRHYLFLVTSCLDEFLPFAYYFCSQLIVFAFIFTVLDVRFAGDPVVNGVPPVLRNLI
jgi:hypothetical protein